MKKVLIILGIVIFILSAGTLLLLKNADKIVDSNYTIEEKRVKYKEILEKDYPNVKNYWQYIPLIFNDELKWDDFSPRDNSVDYRIVKTTKGDEKVSIVDGFRIIYKYPDTEYFAKMHVEKSKQEEYENDKIKVIDELKFIAKEANVSQESYNGYEFYYIGNKDLNLSPIGTAVVFFPEDQIITTIYFLNQEPNDRKFQTIEEFRSLKDSFIKELIDYKVNNSTNI